MNCVGGLMAKNKLFTYNADRWGEWCTDCNSVRHNCTTSLEGSSCENIPEGFLEVGLLHTFGLIDGSYLTQILYGLNSGKTYIRCSTDIQRFSGWRTISLT